MKVRVGFVGAGGIAKVHMKLLAENENVRLTAVTDVASSAADHAASLYGMKPYADYREMLEQESIDALFICVPPFAHGQLELDALERGIHLFVEKPVGLDMDTVNRIAEKISESQVITSTGYCLRYQEGIAQAKEYLQDKTIAMVRGHYLTRFVETPWWREQEKSGGQLVEQATHTLDLIRYLAGDIRNVYAHMALRVFHDVPGLDIPDVGSINLLMESGAVGHLDTSFTQLDHRTGIEILGRDFRVEISGGTVAIVEKERTIIYKSTTDMYKAQDDAFIQAVLTGNRGLVLAPYEEAAKTLQVTLAANESALSDRVVHV
ncbi:Gfo/Idh/MocA family protein [Brevibacillus migulae]|uniref:Gfo/Idh/MocA family protein n=1 Tax=Brevibacillus migulae TaxID=1644114 RepID=UPI00106EB06A|nr:Gfo/Idh/MocA family oxidoreductase [Brevibacillus migulae]